MQEAIQFAVLGLGVGSLYALASQGLILIFRGSGVLNFAYGAIGMVGAYVAWELQYQHGTTFAVAAAAGIGVSTAVGLLTCVLVMRPLRHSTPLARIVGTLGVLVVLQAIAILRYGSAVTVVPSALPTTSLHLFGDVTITVDRLILLGVAAGLSLALTLAYKYSRFGLATSAAAENERGAASLGLSSDLIAAVNWSLGSALAGLAAILISPIVQLQASTMTTLVLAAMAAALIARFVSFPVAFAGGLAIGVIQTVVQRYVSTPGVAGSVPFAVITVVMIISGQGLPLRDYFLQRLPTVGSGRVRPPLVAAGIAAMLALLALVPGSWAAAAGVTLAVSLVLLSIVVITGYAGQISLAQYAIAGIGAYIAGRLVATQGWPFELALLAGVLGTVPVGALFALPAVRTRGTSLAVVTLGLGIAIQLCIFNSPALTGGYAGTVVGEPSFFGLDFGIVAHPARYAIFALGCFTLAGIAVANVRRGRVGRRLLAVRANERAAAALGISVPGVKVYAFSLSAAIAALGGILIGFQTNTVVYSTFEPFNSLLALGWGVIGGIGYIFGPFLGALLAPGSLGAVAANKILHGISEYIELISGGLLILFILTNQDGAAREQILIGRRIAAAVGPLRRPSKPGNRTTSREPRGGEQDRVADRPAHKVTPRVLKVSGLTVRYGAVVAVEDVSAEVAPNRVVGLIGPNGAGKTTAIDAITGFAPAVSGSVVIDDEILDGKSPAARARAGLSRSFQSLELFEDLSVIDNLKAASDRRDRRSYLFDLFWPRRTTLPPVAIAAIREFDLGEVLDRPVGDLSYGQRRLLAIARAVALGPSVLLLDEPAAGLGEAESEELAHLVRRLADEWGMAILLIEHDMNFVMSACDELIVLDFGKVISRGTPDAVRKDPQVRAAYLGGSDDPSEPPDASHGRGAETSAQALGEDGGRR
ncbi:MAG: ATP-binding cassette domain-containing protein [Actinobacteria bacterium]|nr:ATP-binding cassette domain-containing protein [Actinomycetota bacterium]